MRLASSQYFVAGLNAVLFVTLAATLGCQTAQKSSFLPPGQAEAPALVRVSNPGSSPVVNPPGQHAQKATSAAAEPQAKAPVPQALQADPVASLIASVEKEYQTGQDNYNAGHLEAAKQNFDSAFNQLLGSGIDLHSDDRLEAELDRILDGINGLELAALQQGDGFAEQKSEPAPIDEANELTPTVDQNVKAKAEAELKNTHSDLPLVMTDQVAGFINYFSNRGRGTLEHALARSGRYEDMIRRVLREQGVPQELIYLAQAESGFHPLAVSRAGAHHLKDLYNEFGDWYLAMAAYNSGPGTVQSAVKRTGYADFWELYRRNVLPKETRNYVPIIVAVTIMAKNPAQYGLDEVVPEEPMAYDTVKIDYPVDLRLAAECVDATAEDLSDLNPSLLRMTTPKDAEFELHLPAGSADKFLSAVASIPTDKRVWWRYHKVQSGETLAAIARTYHTTPRAIAEANDIDEADAKEPLDAESRLIIPIAAGKQTDTSTYAHATTHYKIRKGDTVESVAENFGVSAKMLRSWNHLKGSSLAGRKVLYLHLPVTRSAGESRLASSGTSRHSSKPAHHAAGRAVSH